MNINLTSLLLGFLNIIVIVLSLYIVFNWKKIVAQNAKKTFIFFITLLTIITIISNYLYFDFTENDRKHTLQRYIQNQDKVMFQRNQIVPKHVDDSSKTISIEYTNTKSEIDKEADKIHKLINKGEK